MSQSQPGSARLAEWPVAILAGGRATRLRPTTETIPKALLEVANRPFIAHQLTLLHSAGFRRIVFCLGHLGRQIETFLGDGATFGLNVSYSFDGQQLLGTGGALKHAMGLLGARFVVLYGDSYLPVDYKPIIDTFLREQKPALMTIFKNDGLWDTSNVWFESGQIHSYNKRMPTPNMRYIEYGIGVLTSEAFDRFEGEKMFDLGEVYEELVKEGRMAVHEVKQRFYEIGSPAGLAELDELLRAQSDTLIP